MVGGSIYPGESRLSATYPVAARPGTVPLESPVAAAHRLAELERSPTVKPTAAQRHDSLLDLRRSRPNDVPSRWEGGSGAQPPCRPWIEAAGLRAVEELAGVFKQVTASGFRTEKVGEPQRRAEREGQSRIKGGGREWYTHFEQWLWACRVDAIVGGGDVVPVLPAVPAAEAQAELARKLEHAGVTPAAAHQACARLAAACARLSRRVAAAPALVAASVSVARPPAKHEGSTRTNQVKRHSPLVRLVFDGTAVECSVAHLEKLRALHAAAAGGPADRTRKQGGMPFSRPPTEGPAAEQNFAVSAFCVLARTFALQGCEARAGGMQAACGAAAFDALRADFGVTMELFASPLNARYGTFCSAGADVDGAFGSVGSFFTLSFARGAYLAHPPFVPAIVEAMAARMDAQLRAADAAGEALTFVVVVPHWKPTGRTGSSPPGSRPRSNEELHPNRSPHWPERRAWQALRDVSGFHKVVELPQEAHGYFDGSQQTSDTLWRASKHPTSVFFLMSERAAAACPVTIPKERRLREAFGRPV